LIGDTVGSDDATACEILRAVRELQHRELMAHAGLAEFSHSVESIDLGVVLQQLHDMECGAESMVEALRDPAGVA
jgi:hypothetical protein